MLENTATDIEMVTVEEQLSVYELNRSNAYRVAGKLNSALDCESLVVLDVGNPQHPLDAEQLRNSFKRYNVTVLDSSATNQASVVCLCLHDLEQLESVLDLARGLQEVILCLPLGSRPDQAPWVRANREASLVLGSTHYRVSGLTALPGVALLARYSQKPSSEDQTLSLSQRVSELEFQLQHSQVAATVVDDPESLVAQRDLRIAELEKKLVEAVQAAYVAQDSLQGAYAEKARADGVAEELHQVKGIQDQEIASLLKELEQRPSGFKAKFRRTAVGSLLAFTTRPLRRVLAKA